MKNAKSIALLTLILLVISEPSLAATTPIENMLNGIVSFFNSAIMRTIAIIAVIVLGLMAFFGKLSWERAGYVVAGIVLTFGASALVDQFSGFVTA